MLCWLCGAVHPRARQFLIDWELEESAQPGVLDGLRALAESCPAEQGEVWLLRHIHRLPERRLRAVLEICAGASQRVSGTAGNVPRVVCATTYEMTFSSSMSEQIQDAFPLTIRLTGLPKDRSALTRISLGILRALDVRHGKGIAAIDPRVIDLFVDRHWSAHFLELESLIERAYFWEPTSCLTIEAFESQRQRNDGEGEECDLRSFDIGADLASVGKMSSTGLVKAVPAVGSGYPARSRKRVAPSTLAPQTGRSREFVGTPST
ncbi:MAG: hypothetical protein HY304_04705 [candidate division Zixibacteria bacterium]|nr:hypothetical protein [candidate division Zixibacteria bacterium]